MTPYRIYVLDGQDHVACAREDRFASDRAALEAAEDARAGQYAAEVWQGERLVARLGGEFLVENVQDELQARPQRPRLRAGSRR